MGVQFHGRACTFISPSISKDETIIDQGDLGEIQYIYSNRLNLGTFRTNENVFWSFAPHDVALFNFFFEENPLTIILRLG